MKPVFHFRTYADLSRDIAGSLQRVPDADIVVGVPRSGVVPAVMIASALNRPFFDLESFIFAHGTRSGLRKLSPAVDSLSDQKIRVILVDDSINTGTERDRVLSRVSHMTSRVEFVFLAVYGVPGADYPENVCVMTRVPQPRVFQWNYRHHIIAEHSLFDMDGVLCEDPAEADNDDGPQYERFLQNARPLAIPPKTISAIVTSRLERYRALTEAWLSLHGVRYRELVMLQGVTAEERRARRLHASFKADVYASRDELLFVESNWKQALEIAARTDKAVICTANDQLLRGRAGAERARATDDSGSVEAISDVLQVALERLAETDPAACAWIAENTFDKKRKTFRLANSWQRNRAAIVATNGTRPPVRAVASGRVHSGEIRRVLAVAYSFDVKRGAGAAMSAGRLCSALQDRGLEVRRFSLDDAKADPQASRALPVMGTRIPFWRSFHDRDAERRFLEEVEKFEPDCVLFNAVDRDVVPLLSVPFVKAPIVWVVRDNWVHTGGCLFKLEPEAVESAPPVDEEFLAALTCQGYRDGCQTCPAVVDSRESGVARLGYELRQEVFGYRSDIVFAPISSWMASMLQSAPLTRRHRVDAVYNPIDRASVRRVRGTRSALREKYGLPLEGPIVLLAAHSVTNPRKGVVPAMAAVAEEPELSEVVFVALGRGGEEIPGGKVRSLGFVEDQEAKNEIYSCVDAVLVPSLQESLSVVASDAVCCGTPVVAFDASGIGSFLGHQKSGYLARPFDFKDLASGLSWVLFHSDSYRLRSECEIVASETFDAEVNTQKIESLMSVAAERYCELGDVPSSFEVWRRLLAYWDNDARFMHVRRRYLEKRLENE